MRSRLVTKLVVFCLATAVWLPAVPLLFRPPPRAELVEGLAQTRRR